MATALVVATLTVTLARMRVIHMAGNLPAGNLMAGSLPVGKTEMVLMVATVGVKLGDCLRSWDALAVLTVAGGLQAPEGSLCKAQQLAADFARLHG